MIVEEEWIGNTALRVDIINSFDHEGDGIPTDQIATAVFYLFVVGAYSNHIATFKFWKNVDYQFWR